MTDDLAWKKAALDRPELVVAKAQPVDHTRAKALEEHVGRWDQPLDDLPAGVGFEIDG